MKTYQTILTHSVYFLCFVWLIGCAGPEKTEEPEMFFSEWKARAEKTKGYSPTQSHQSQDLEKTKPVKEQATPIALEEVKPLPTRKITMKMTDVDVAVLLRALARVARQNIMINEKVSGKVNINITNAPWDQAFKGLLRTTGLTYDWEGNIIRVMTVEDMEIELKREAQQLELKRVMPLTTRLVEVDYAEAGKLKENLEKLLALDREKAPLGSVMVDEHTNSLIIRAIPNDIQKLVSVIEILDRPTSQVLIEAHIVQTTNQTARELGIQWGGLAKGSSNGKNVWLGPGYDIPPGTSLIDENGNNVVVRPDAGNVFNFPADLAGTGMSLGFLFQNVGNLVLTAELTALEEEGKLNILSSPSITTVDNQVAVIEAGDRVPIQTVENGEVNVDYQDAVLKLEVTPHVIKDGTLKLKIDVNKDELDFTRTVAGNPTIVTRKAETTVIVFNGQTTVIGGLSEETATKQTSGVPWLKNIPGLGWLFKSEGKEQDLDDLLIFITPYVLEEKSAAAVQSSNETSSSMKATDN